MIDFIDQVLIQRFVNNDNDNLNSAERGFKKLGISTQFFDPSQLEMLPLTKNTLVCGGIGTVRRALRLLNVPEPEIVDYPSELKNFYGRKIWQSTLGSVRENDLDNIFIKPIDAKLFVGHIRGSAGYLIQTAPYENDVKIWCSEPVKFESEYRVFISSGQIVGCKHYKGNFLIFPDVSVIKSCVELLKNKHLTYSLDIGVTDNNSTLVVEINDAFSLGSYGLADIVYAKMLENRWLEMVNTDGKDN